METPPSNYNQNESVLAGGINSSTPILMVQGGGGVLNSYNETASVLEGGINSSTPITMLQGGGVENNVQIISEYTTLNSNQYERFKERFSKTGQFNKALNLLKPMYDKKTEKVLHYRKVGSYIESSNIRNTSSDMIQLKLIRRLIKWRMKM